MSALTEKLIRIRDLTWQGALALSRDERDALADAVNVIEAAGAKADEVGLLAANPIAKGEDVHDRKEQIHDAAQELRTILGRIR